MRRRERRKANWSRDPKVDLTCKEIGASRALYQGREEEARVLLRVATTDDQVVEIEMSARQAGTLIEQATQAYYAIVPQLRTRRNL